MIKNLSRKIKSVFGIFNSQFQENPVPVPVKKKSSKPPFIK